MAIKNNIAGLAHRMAAAAAAQDFEVARRLRDQINDTRGASPTEATRADTAGLSRQKSRAMGIGTNVPTPVRPAGWHAPKKPDEMT